MTPWVMLTDGQLRRAVEIGKVRDSRAAANGWRPTDGAFAGTDESLYNNIIGTYGEFALAIYLGLPEPDLQSLELFKAADVGRDLQVRTRNTVNRKPKCDHLIVREKDADDHRFVLVTFMVPFFDLRGWQFGRECKQPRYLYGYGGRMRSYFVPPADLLSVEMLKETP